MHDIFYISRFTQPDTQFTYLKNKFMHVKTATSFKEAQLKALTSFFWIVWDDIIVDDSFDFSYEPDSGSKNYAHVFLNNNSYDGISLVPKHMDFSVREIEHRFFVNKKEVAVVASTPKPYDKFYIETYDDYLIAVEKSNTPLFWMLTHNVTPYHEVLDNFHITYHDTYLKKQNHAFSNETFDDAKSYGVYLLSKDKLVSKKEIEFKHIIDAEHHDLVVSKKVKYDMFVIDSYDDYVHAYKTSTTEMFWGTSNNITLNDEYQFDMYFAFDNFYDRHENHAFIHRVNDTDLYNGVFLFSKRKPVTQKEIEFRHLVSRKEWNIVASGPKAYDVFEIDSYEEYLNALETSSTEMFWMSSRNLLASIPNLYFTHDNHYDRKQTHAFIHQTDDTQLYNGVFLCSKHAPLTKKEVEYRYPVEKKEWNIVASGPKKYEIFKTNSYDDYVNAYNQAKTEMFWMIPNNVILNDDFDFSLYFNHSQEFERSHAHAFLNGDYYDGVVLCSKHTIITKREFDYGFIANKVETGIAASTPKLFDVVFISFNEENAEENYKKLLLKCPTAKRVHGVVGIHNAHIQAAEITTTPMIWIVDGDAVIEDDFDFAYQPPKWDFNTVHVWRSKNPVNGLTYGYGGVKLFPRELTLNMDTSLPDMTTSISKNFKPMQQVSNITQFNTSPFAAWKSAFRECVKLSSKVISRQKDAETYERLSTWQSVGVDQMYGQYALAGASMGTKYGEAHRDDIEKLKKINDFAWLEEVFNDTFK